MAPSPSGEGVTLVHDYLLVMRGAERTVAAIADMYPRAPMFALLYDEQGTRGRFAGRSVTTSPLQRLGVGQSNFRRLMPLYPWAVEQLKLAPSELVLSSSSAFAHGVRVPLGAIHICYCHAPFRYVWYEEARALAEAPRLLRTAARWELARMRRWDVDASTRVHSYIANSQLTRERIRSFYGRESRVIHPPVETHRFSPGEPGDALLVVSELVRHKRLRTALEAARRAKVPIRVVGSGPDHGALQEAYPEAEFLGRADDEQLAGLYASARALVMPSREEFGITSVEAQASGRPVIAAAAGGALETVLDGVTGRLVGLDDIDGFVAAIEGIDAMGFEPARAVENAERFSVEAFQGHLAAEVERVLHQAGADAGAGAGAQSRSS